MLPIKRRWLRCIRNGVEHDANNLVRAQSTRFPGRAAGDPHGSRGEFVVMIHGAKPVTDSDQTTQDTDRLLQILLAEVPLKTAAKMAADITGRKKNELYQRALQLKDIV